MVTRFLSSLLFLAAVNTGIVQAQVVPDGTLPTVVEQLENMRKITGGERVGNNLFHSFEEFSIPEGIEAIFENGLDIENIFTRITGSDISVIDGLLKTAGGANFFLINPNGIVFGENAQLDIGGSFIATTANKIEFADGTNWHAAPDEAKVTLTISVPIGLRLDGNNGSITVNGSGEQINRQEGFTGNPYLRNRTSGLSVPSGETLALIGKGIDFNGGAIVTEGGSIKLGSVDVGQVRIDENIDRGGWTLAYEEITAFENINFARNALIDSSLGDSSSIEVFGKDIIFTDNSILLIQNNETTGDGAIKINASNLLEIDNQSNIITETIGEGNASPISISAQNLLVQNEGAISSGTYGLGRGGDINIVVSEKLEVINSITLITPGTIYAFTADAGNSGNISISTQELSARLGSSISSSTSDNGNGGNINISADSIELDGTIGENGAPTFIGSVTFGEKGADAGEVNLEVANLKLINGAAISSDSSSNASSGNVNVNATDSIEVIGTETDRPFLSSITSSVTVEENEFIRSLLGLPLNPGGNAGNVTVSTPTLNISQGGAISVRNEGTGNAGEVTITADRLNLDEAASITAAASSGIGGDIVLNTDSLNISNDSQITATVGGDGDGGNITINTTNLTAKKNNQITASAEEGDGGNIILNADSVSLNDRDEISAASTSGDGGNININTDILTALEQSRITANSISGDGGNITINSRGYFVSEDSVVSASSEFGLDGTININSLENNFQQYLEEPEVEITIIPDFFIPRCANPDRAYLTLFPGDVLPESPDNYYSYPSQTDTEVVLQEPEYQEKLDRIVQRHLERLESEPEREIEEPETETEPKSGLIWQPGDPMINATEIVETEDGKVFLVPPAEKQEFLRLLRCGQSVK